MVFIIRMKSGFLFILLILGISAVAQQGPQLMLPEIDSFEIESGETVMPEVAPESGMLNSDLFYSIKPVPLNIDQAYFDRYMLNSSLVNMPEINYIPETSFMPNSPFYTDGEIFGGSATQLNDKITIGGFSYGANSVFSAPLPNQRNSYYDTYGSTMFMQYKVSKNFKIETRVSVGHNQGPPPPPGF